MRTLIIFGLRVWAKNRQFIDHPDYNMITWGDSVLNCVKCSPQILGNMKPFWQWGFELVFQPHTTDHLSFAVTHHHLKTSPGQKNKTHIPKNRQQSDSTSQVQERLDPATKRTILHKTRRFCEWPKSRWRNRMMVFLNLHLFLVFYFRWRHMANGFNPERLCLYAWFMAEILEPRLFSVRKVAWLHPMEKCREPVTHEINVTNGIFSCNWI